MIDALVPANKALLAGEGLPPRGENGACGCRGNGEGGGAGAGRSSYLSARSLTNVLIPAPWPSQKSLPRSRPCTNPAQESAASCVTRVSPRSGTICRRPKHR